MSLDPNRVMKKPVPPSLSDFGLSEAEYEKAPKLLCHSFSEKTYTRIGLVAGAATGVAAFFGLLNKMESALHGWYFGLPVGFVTFLMASFLLAVFIKYLILLLSAAQRRVYSALSKTNKQALAYGDAMHEYDVAMDKFKKLYR